MPELSPRAIEMLKHAERETMPTDPVEVAKIIKDAGYPVYDAVLKFQERFGGITYCINGSDYQGYRLGIFDFYKSQNKFEFDPWEEDEKEPYGDYKIVCANYLYAAPVRILMNSAGQIFDLDGEEMAAESIEYFLEKDAVKDYFCHKQGFWLKKELDSKKVRAGLIKKKNEFVKIKEASDSCSEWWMNKNESIFLEIYRLGSEKEKGKIYATSKELIEEFIGEKIKKAFVYPNFEEFNFE